MAFLKSSSSIFLSRKITHEEMSGQRPVVSML
jgi:hypothetical protein